MRTVHRSSGTLIAALALATACSNAGSTPNTVAVPSTEVKDQGGVGLCWAYAATAFIESQHLAATGQQLDLSEEYLGALKLARAFVNVTKRIAAMPETERAAAHEAMLAELRKEGATGPWQWNWIEDPEGGDEDVVDLLREFGVVPETAFSTKFPYSEETGEADDKAINARFLDMTTRMADLWTDASRPLSMEQIIHGAVEGSKAFPGALPETVEHAGRQLTPQEYLKEVGFRLEDYSVVYAGKMSDYDPLVAAMRKSLARGVPVIANFSSDFSRRNGSEFGGSVWQNFNPNFGHYVLATDFVNRGGTPGAMANVNAELDKHPRLLSHFIAKNSWGIKDGDDGFVSITKDFFLANFHSRLKSQWDFLLPRDLADEYRAATR